MNIDGKKAVIIAKNSSDNTLVLTDGQCQIKNGKIVYNFPKDVFTEGGITLNCQIRLYEVYGEDALNSAVFSIYVDPALLMDSGDIISSNEYKALTDALGEVQAAHDAFINDKGTYIQCVNDIGSGANTILISQSEINALSDLSGNIICVIPSFTNTSSSVWFQPNAWKADVELKMLKSDGAITASIPIGAIVKGVPMLIWTRANGSTHDVIWINRKETAGYADVIHAGLVKAYREIDAELSGVYIDSSGKLLLSAATDTEIEAKSNTRKPIVPSNLVKAVTVGGEGVFVKLNDLTDYVKKIDYASTSAHGVVQVGSGLAAKQGVLTTLRASDAQIEGKSDVFSPIVPYNLVKAVTVGGEGVFEPIFPVETTLPEVLEVGKHYQISFTDGITINLPDSANDKDRIKVDYYNAGTVTKSVIWKTASTVGTNAPILSNNIASGGIASCTVKSLHSADCWYSSLAGKWIVDIEKMVTIIK